MRKISLTVGAALLVVGPVSAQPAQAQENAAYVTWQSPQEGARLSGRTVHIMSDSPAWKRAIITFKSGTIVKTTRSM